MVGCYSTYLFRNTENNCFITNVFVECAGVILGRWVFWIPLGTHCAPLLAYLFLYSYEVGFIQILIKSGKRHLSKL